MNVVRFSVASLSIAVLQGCGFIYGDDGLIRSQEYDYVTAKQSKELSMPNGLVHKDKADFTQLPKIGKQAESLPLGKALDQEAPVQLLAVLENTRVDKKSKAPGVFILDKAEFIWKSVEDFLATQQIKTLVNNSSSHEIETDWMAIEEGGIWLGLDGTEEPDLHRAKYKITMTEGQIQGEQKLLVERTQSESREDNDEPWQSQYITWQESADMMNLLLSHYDRAIREKEARYFQQVMAGFKVELGQDEQGNAALLTQAKHQLIWEKTPKVMRELGFKIIDKDLRQKTYFMEFEKPEQGFFASLFEEAPSEIPLEAGAYQVTLGTNGASSSITFKDAQGTPLEANLMVKLFPELSRLFGDRR